MGIITILEAKKLLVDSIFRCEHTGSVAKKKDLYRIKGKGRRCCLGDKVDLIPCRASYFAPGRIEE